MFKRHFVCLIIYLPRITALFILSQANGRQFQIQRSKIYSKTLKINILDKYLILLFSKLNQVSINQNKNKQINK